MKFDVFAAVIQAVFAGVGGGEDVQRHGVLDLCILHRGNLEQIVGAQIHDHKLVPFQEPESIGAGLQSLPPNFQRDLVDEIALILFTQASRVTGTVHQARKNEEPVGVTHAARVAQLRGGSLPAEEYFLRQDLGSDVGCL